MHRYVKFLLVATLFAGIGSGCFSQGSVPADDKAAAIEAMKRGLSWISKGDNDKAMKEFDEAIRLDPKQAPHFVMRSAAWSTKKEYDKAIKDLDEAIRLDPKSVVAFYNRGDAWKQKKEYDKAVKDLDEVIRLNPKFLSAHYNKACCLALQGKADPALDALEKALEIGYPNFGHIKTDADLNSIRKNERFVELLEKYSK